MLNIEARSLKTTIMAVTATISLLFGICQAGELQSEATAPKEKKDRISYSIGYQIGSDLKKHSKGVDASAFLQGTRDAQASTPAMAEKEMGATLVKFKKAITTTKKAEAATGPPAAPGKNSRAEALFLVENRAKEGVVTLASGLQYKIINKGSGRTPTLSDLVTVHYRGTLIDGSEFYSTRRKGGPEKLPIEKTIAGWQEALPLMPAGSRWQLFMSHHLAYGERGPLADRTVIFDLELIEVN
jgi:FKBP-type peptidyl-prolyl cis-trans isomerase FklB